MKVEEIEIPDAWCEALVDVQKYDRNACIAGGAIRDLYCGCTIKDIDIFTRSMPSWPLEESSIDYEGMKFVDAVAVGTYHSLQYNLILISAASNNELISSFDFGLCQIGFDGKSIFRTEAFDWDFKYNLFTLRHIDRYARSIRRYSRWIERYNFDIAIPQLEKPNALPL